MSHALRLNKLLVVIPMFTSMTVHYVKTYWNVWHRETVKTIKCIMYIIIIYIYLYRYSICRICIRCHVSSSIQKSSLSLSKSCEKKNLQECLRHDPIPFLSSNIHRTPFRTAARTMSRSFRRSSESVSRPAASPSFGEGRNISRTSPCFRIYFFNECGTMPKVLSLF